MAANFRDKYVVACSENDVAPLQSFLDKLSISSKGNSTNPEQLESALTVRELKTLLWK
jgi:hypothetical protein